MVEQSRAMDRNSDPRISGRYWDAAPWNRRSTLTHFRQEAESLLKTKAAPLADVSLPESAQAHYDRGRGLMDKNQTPIDCRLQRSNPRGAGNGRALRRGGEAHAILGNRDQAMADFNEAIQFDGTWRKLWSRGSLYFDQGQWDKAEADFKAAPSPQSVLRKAFLERGEAWRKANHLERLLTEYRSKAVWLDPQYMEICLRQMANWPDKRAAGPDPGRPLANHATENRNRPRFAALGVMLAPSGDARYGEASWSDLGIGHALGSIDVRVWTAGSYERWLSRGALALRRWSPERQRDRNSCL